MKSRSLTKIVVFLLAVAITFPAAFLIAPSRVSADSGVGCLSGIAAGLVSAAVNKVTSVPGADIPISVATFTTAGATVGKCVNDLILVPLAKAMIRAMLQKLTASVVNWINNTPGKGGTTAPSFVTNISVNLQGAGDAVAIPFISQIATALNSPFGSAISSSLQLNYNRNTSMAGFFAANQNTMSKVSPNVNAYLNGNWSQGGVAAWFTLTTQPQNNPYTLYQTAQSQLSTNVGQTQAARKQDLSQSNGFLSWCGTSDTSTQKEDTAAAAYATCSEKCNANGNTDACGAACVADYNKAGGAFGGSSKGVNPGDTCTNSDGSPGSVQTPGSVIHGYTQQAVVNSGFQQLISANDLDSALGQIVNALVNQVMGGAKGLLGTSQPQSGGRPSVTSNLSNYTPNTTAASNAATSMAQATLDRISGYVAAWKTIENSANTAAAALNSLSANCSADAGTVITAAQAALANTVAPIIAQAQAAYASTEDIKNFAIKVGDEETAAKTTQANITTLSDDIQKLITMHPDASDVVATQSNATASGGSTSTGTLASSPQSMLTVSGGTTVDQMNLIAANAAALESSTVCKPPSGGGGGQGSGSD